MSYKEICDRILSGVAEPGFRVVYWDGDERTYGSNAPEAFTVHLRDERVCPALFRNMSLGFGEAYTGGDIDVDGDWRSLMRLMFSIEVPRSAMTAIGNLANAYQAWRYRNTLNGARRNISFHYDLGNEFFQLWLDQAMTYSCAYFQSPDDDIDTAQANKREHLCRKLLLSPDDHVLDIGCGWGAFVIHAAKLHGVRCHGITLSREQRDFVEKRIEQDGLQDKVRVQVQDYREVDAKAGFDRVVSIGMFEHVGKDNIPTYMQKAAELLAQDGVGVLHTIGRRKGGPSDPWLNKYIFPGAYFPTLAEISAPLEQSGLTIRDVEVLGNHYELTLLAWAKRFEAHLDEIREMYDEALVRRWRLYLYSCAAAFRHGDYTVWQIQFDKNKRARIPLTRNYLYG